MSKAKGKFIVFEGPDGSGQTTQVNLLADNLKGRGFQIITTAEPTPDSQFSEKIYNILHKKITATPKEIQELTSSDRGEHLKNLILPSLQKGELVISSRYFFSTFAYGLLDCEFDWLKSLNEDYPLPDITFVLDVRPEVCIERIIKRGREVEFFETREKLAKVLDNYKKIVPMFPNAYLINGERPIEVVHQEILSLVNKVIK